MPILPPPSNAYLLAWNAENWVFKDLEQKIDEIISIGKTTVIWSIASHRKVQIGDRIFIIKLGKGVRGIFASGYILSMPKLLPHWSGIGVAYRSVLELDTLLNPGTENILSIDNLKNSVSEHHHWSPQQSGIQINFKIIDDLEKVWFQFLKGHNLFPKSASAIVLEGTPYQRTQTFYERNPYVRKRCLDYHGYACKVCEMNFYSCYGEIGRDFIHVHHLEQLSEIGKAHEINPIADLRPVCPNCHAMLHKRNPCLTIDELKGYLK